MGLLVGGGLYNSSAHTPLNCDDHSSLLASPYLHFISKKVCKLLVQYIPDGNMKRMSLPSASSITILQVASIQNQSSLNLLQRCRPLEI